MIIFENFGAIDPLAICTFGVSAKEKDNPIGFFAILLRSDHRVTIQSGKNSHVFSLKPTTIRNQPFNLVAMDDQPMGFTERQGFFGLDTDMPSFYAAIEQAMNSQPEAA